MPSTAHHHFQIFVCTLRNGYAHFYVYKYILHEWGAHEVKREKSFTPHRHIWRCPDTGPLHRFGKIIRNEANRNYYDVKNVIQSIIHQTIKRHKVSIDRLKSNRSTICRIFFGINFNLIYVSRHRWLASHRTKNESQPIFGIEIHYDGRCAYSIHDRIYFGYLML